MARGSALRAIVVLRLPAEIAAQIVEHAQSGYPDEICWLVAGHYLPLHPRGPKTPSPTDIAHAFYPESVYLIVSLATPDQPVVRGFRITDRGHERLL